MFPSRGGCHEAQPSLWPQCSAFPSRSRRSRRRAEDRGVHEERHQPVLESGAGRRRQGRQQLGADIEHAAPTKPDNIEEQTRLVEDWIVRKPAAMVFVPVDFKALVPSIQKVNQAGIPVVIFSNRMSDVASSPTSARTTRRSATRSPST